MSLQDKKSHSKSYVIHIFAFFLAGLILLLYIATQFPLNQSDTFLFKFGHFKGSNYPDDMETSLKKRFQPFLTGSKKML